MSDTIPPGWNEPPDEHDERILLGLRELWDDADRPPDFLVDQVRLALGLVDLDAEMLRLVQTERLPVARGAEHTRRITFSDEKLTIMINVAANPDGTVRVDGWLAPEAACVVEVRVGGRSVSATADDGGRFALPWVPSGLAQLVVRQVGATTRTVTTPAVEL